MQQSEVAAPRQQSEPKQRNGGNEVAATKQQQLSNSIETQRSADVLDVFAY